MKISVITVCYNSERHIADTLRSVDAQRGVDIEHLVIDGASKDNTLAIVSQFPQTWRRVTSERDKGIYDAMNKGLAQATGDVIGFINSDDFYAGPDVLAGIVRAFEDPKVEACWGDLCYVQAEDTGQIVRYWRSNAFKPGLFRTGWCPPHPTFYVRRSVYERCGFFDTKYRLAADFELMARFLEKFRVGSAYIPGVVVRMRMGGATNSSLRNIVRQNREGWAALQGLGLRPTLISFGLGKVLSRGRQFFVRPPTP